MPKRKIILNHEKAPGDIVAFTAVVRDLKLHYGDDIQIDIRTSWPVMFENNPYITPLHSRNDKAALYQLHYRDGIRRAGHGEKLHFITEFHNQVKQLTGLKAPVLLSKPDLHLTEFEKTHAPISGRYWLVFGGGKSDITNKHWRYAWYRDVVSQLSQEGLQFVQSGGTKEGHVHPPIPDILNIVGWGGLREMMWQIYHAEGVICPVTCAMHMAAAFDKPCVVIAGGREEPWWEHYSDEYGAFGPAAAPVKVPHRFLHTLGQLECCATRGCWKQNVLKINKVDSLCWKPLIVPGTQTVPMCMDMITVDMVKQAVLSYYQDGTLPPLTQQPVPNVITEFGKALVPPADSPKLLAVQLPPQVTPTSPELPRAVTSRMNLMDHPTIGGKITVCLLCYGEYFELHKACLDSIINTIPEDRRDLRIGLNAVTDATRNYIAQLPVTKVYDHPENAKKYPVMREMFWDPSCPINTNYVVWFDDDTYAVNSRWLTVLAETIINQKDAKVGMYGDILRHHVGISPTGYDRREWFKTGDWHRGRPMRTSSGGEAPNGDWIHFCTGWHWALSVEAMRACNIPDSRLNHNGGDCLIGEQLWQGGYALKQYNHAKSLIYTARDNRRGFSETFLWNRI